MDIYNEVKHKDESNISNENILFTNIGKSKEIKMDNLEDNLNISDIKDEINKNQKSTSSKFNKCLQFLTNQSFEEDFSEDLNDINEEFSQRKITISSFQSDEFNNNNVNTNLNINNINNKRGNFENKKISKKITKEDLNNIPLPVFSCIYCSNDKIAFKHLLLEIITNKYLFQTSIYDIRNINNLIIYQTNLDKDNKNNKLLEMVIKNTEYITKEYTKENIIEYFSSNYFYKLCKKELFNNKKYFIQKIEENIIKKKKDFYFKGINKIPKNSLNNKCLFNSTNSLINNYNSLSGFVESIQGCNNINAGKNNNINSLNTSINFNSISLNNNEIGNNNLCKDNNLLVSIVEHIENNIGGTNEIYDKEEIIDIFGFDIERKITKENIIWDSKYYEIWNPIISDEEDNEELNNNNKILTFKKSIFSQKEKIKELSQRRYKLKVNLLKSKTSNNSFNCHINNKLSVSQIKSLGSTNNSSVINCDNEIKTKSNILSCPKDIINNSDKTIHNSTYQIN